MDGIDKGAVIRKAREFARAALADKGSSHGMGHTERVVQLAKKIAQQEGGDIFIVELAALLHDVDDHKYHQSKDRTKEWLLRNAGAKAARQVMDIIDKVSFKGGTKSFMKSKEGMAVQDADRLDAMGAIGIARTFNFGGERRTDIYDESDPTLGRTDKISTVNHFHEKLLLLKDRMNTKTGKKMAVRRHRFMLKYLEELKKDITSS